MCRICAEWLLGKISTKEALRNLNEVKDALLNTDQELDHYYEVAEKLAESDYED